MKTITYEQRYVYNGLGEDLLIRAIERLECKPEYQWLIQQGFEPNKQHKYDIERDWYNFKVVFSIPDEMLTLLLLQFPEQDTVIDLED